MRILSSSGEGLSEICRCTSTVARMRRVQGLKTQDLPRARVAKLGHLLTPPRPVYVKPYISGLLVTVYYTVPGILVTSEKLSASCTLFELEPELLLLNSSLTTNCDIHDQDGDTFDSISCQACRLSRFALLLFTCVCR